MNHRSTPNINAKQKNYRPGVIVIEGHVQSLANTRLLGQVGIPVIVIDKDDCIAQYSKYCKAFDKCPDYLNEEFIDFLIRLNKAFNLQNWIIIPLQKNLFPSIKRCFK